MVPSQFKSLKDLSLDDLQLQQVIHEYEGQLDFNLTIGDNIYNYLTSKKGFIQHKRHVELSSEAEHLYRQSFSTLVAKGSPIITFFASFSPKITNPSITNHKLLPDMSDLLTFIHLHLLAKHVRSFYDYGFRFIIAYKGFLYQPIMKWTDETVTKTFHLLHELIQTAERITGVRNVVEMIDFMDLIETEGDYFTTQWEKEKKNVLLLYQNEDPYITRKINGWLKDFSTTIDQKDFCDFSPEQFQQFMLEQAVSIRALKNIQFKGGEKGNGICNSLPPTVRTSIRGIDPGLSIQINPFFRFHSHQRLIAFSVKENNWKTVKWEDISATCTPVYVQEYNHPFYYIIND